MSADRPTMTIWPAAAATGEHQEAHHTYVRSVGLSMALNAVVSGVLLLVLGGGLTLFPATTADIFCDNLKQVAATLPNKTASSPQHFATTAFGHAPGIVYAFALCRGDVADDSFCGVCVSRAFDTLLNNSMPPQPQLPCNKTGHRARDRCVLVYSADDDILNATTKGKNVAGGDPPDAVWNGVTWAQIGFDQLGPRDLSRGAGHVRDLLAQTVQATAAGTTLARFATGFMDTGDARRFPAVYSLAQCTPDMSAGDCLACLGRLLGMVNESMAARVGGQIHVARCNLRYEMYRFYNGTPMIRLSAASAPAPAMTAVKHKSMYDSFPWLWDLSKRKKKLPMVLFVLLSSSMHACAYEMNFVLLI